MNKLSIDHMLPIDRTWTLEFYRKGNRLDFRVPGLFEIGIHFDRNERMDKKV